MTSAPFLPAVHARPDSSEVVRPSGSQRGSQEGAFTAPEAAHQIFRICQLCLLGLDHSSPRYPRLFRVYSGSWKLLP